MEQNVKTTKVKLVNRKGYRKVKREIFKGFTEAVEVYNSIIGTIDKARIEGKPFSEFTDEELLEAREVVKGGIKILAFHCDVKQVDQLLEDSLKEVAEVMEGDTHLKLGFLLMVKRNSKLFMMVRGVREELDIMLKDTDWFIETYFKRDRSVKLEA